MKVSNIYIFDYEIEYYLHKEIISINIKYHELCRYKSFCVCLGFSWIVFLLFVIEKTMLNVLLNYYLQCPNLIDLRISKKLPKKYTKFLKIANDFKSLRNGLENFSILDIFYASMYA